MKKNVLIVIVAVCLISSVAWAERSIHENRAVSPDGSVEVINIAGAIEVVGWDRAEVELTGTLGDSIEKVEFEVTGDRTRIEVKYPKHSKNNGRAELKIMIPSGSDLEVEAVSAEVSASGILGKLDLESVSGDVDVFGIPAEIDAESVSGDVTVELASGDVDLEAVSGNILIREVRGELEAATVSGDITVESGVLEGGNFETVSGKIMIDVALDRGRVEMESMSGNIKLIVPPSTSADFEIETFSGSIDNNLTGDRAVRTSKHAPGSELQFSTGSGGPKVELSSFSGSVTVGDR